MAVTADVCPIYRDAADRSLSSAGFNIQGLLGAASAPPGRLYEANQALIQSFVESGQQGLSFPVFQKTLSLLQCLPKEFPMPGISIESATSVELDWDEGVQRVAAVTIDEDQRLGFASLVNGDSNYGRFVFAEGSCEIPEPLRDILSRIYPRRSRRAA